MLQGANFSYALIDGTTVVPDDFLFWKEVYQILSNANLQAASLRNRQLIGVDLRKANLQEANLSGADLQGAKLQEADLSRAILKNAKLGRVNLRAANLQASDLQNSILRNSNLKGANFVGANMQNVDLQGADLRDATLPPRIILDKQEVNLKGANLEGCIFVNVEEHELVKLESKLWSKRLSTNRSLAEAEEKLRLSIVYRRGQPEFRTALLQEFQYRCIITGCDAEAALEAAHIIPYCKTEDNTPQNGLLLRADIHTLFDLHLLAINPDEMVTELHSSIANRLPYKQLTEGVPRWKLDTGLYRLILDRREALHHHFFKFCENK